MDGSPSAALLELVPVADEVVEDVDDGVVVELPSVLDGPGSDEDWVSAAAVVVGAVEDGTVDGVVVSAEALVVEISLEVLVTAELDTWDDSGEEEVAVTKYDGLPVKVVQDTPMIVCARPAST